MAAPRVRGNAWTLMPDESATGGGHALPALVQVCEAAGSALTGPQIVCVLSMGALDRRSNVGQRCNSAACVHDVHSMVCACGLRWRSSPHLSHAPPHVSLALPLARVVGAGQGQRAMLLVALRPRG